MLFALGAFNIPVAGPWLGSLLAVAALLMMWWFWTG